jgi:maltooligosyltrehalose synthase
MQIERLSLLAEVLESQKLVANVSFDISTWLDGDTGTDSDHVFLSPVTRERVSAGTGKDNYAVVDPSQLSCGTVACAVGHATLIPEFQALGLKMVRDITPEPSAFGAMPFFDGKVSWDAVRAFFDIDESWTHYLFLGSSYDYDAGPDQVAVRIREVIADELHERAITQSGN